MSPADFGCVLAASDFSASAEAAWTVAQRLARALGAELVLVHVVMEPAMYAGAPFARGLAGDAQAEARKSAQEQAARWAETARAGSLGSVRVDLRVGDVPQQIVEAAAQARAGLVVVGTQGGVRRALLGSVADKVIRLAPCPVVVVHESP